MKKVQRGHIMCPRLQDQSEAEIHVNIFSYAYVQSRHMYKEIAGSEDRLLLTFTYLSDPEQILYLLLAIKVSFAFVVGKIK